MNLILILFSALSTFIICTQATAPCSYHKQDSVFILDSSESISQNDFKLAKEFIIKMVSFFKTTNSDNRIAFIVFGNDARLIFNLDRHSKLDDMIKDIKHVENKNELTAIGKALRLTLTDVVPKMRKDAQKIVILFTDGSNNVYPSPHIYATNLKEASVRILAVGIGSHINKHELTAIASPKLSVMVPNFYGLIDHLRKVVHHICVIVDPVPTVPCQLKQQDLVILLDASDSISKENYEYAKGFLINFLHKLEISHDKTRVAMISFSDEIRLDFNFDLANKNKIIEVIKHMKKFGTATGIGKALSETYAKLQPKQRTGVPFNVLLITDGMNNMYPRPLGEADKLKKNGAHIVTLGIGRDVNINELKAISSNDKVLTVHSYKELQNNLKAVMKTVTCG